MELQKTWKVAVLGVPLAVAACGGTTESMGDAGTSGSGGGGHSGGGPVAVAISPGEGAHAISPLIYGINGAAAAPSARATSVRLGGYGRPAYNWEINATNAGKVAGFSNAAASPGTAPGAAAQEVFDAAKANGGAAVIAIPIGDYVAADKTPGNVNASGSGYLATRFRKNKPVKGQPFLAKPDASDDSVYQDEFVAWAKGAAAGTPVLFSLDNEPELWADDHTEIHPARTTYDELVTRNVAFAKSIKAAWAQAPVMGGATYGWQGYENLQNAPDSQAKGEFLSYYLAQMSAAGKTNGKRLIDYLDLHWWPEAQGAGTRIIGPEAALEIVDARISAPRSLWDSTYHEVSWINDALGASGESINLLPRLQGKIDQHYPGTKLAFSAWYYGGGGDISGAIATVDVLGIFGRDGVDLAAVALSEDDDSFTLAGFQAFLNFDGAGAHFGDTSVKATVSDPAGASAYASIDSTDPTRVVVIVLNKQREARSATVTIGGASNYSTCAVFTLAASKATFAAGTPLAVAESNTFEFAMPALSVSVLVPKP